jgi:hypothetical protein
MRGASDETQPTPRAGAFSWKLKSLGQPAPVDLTLKRTLIERPLWGSDSGSGQAAIGQKPSFDHPVGA